MSASLSFFSFLFTSRVFTDQLSNSPKRLPWFLPGYEGMENMFYFLSKYCSAFPGNNCQLKSVTVRWKQGYGLKFTFC